MAGWGGDSTLPVDVGPPKRQDSRGGLPDPVHIKALSAAARRDEALVEMANEATVFFRAATAALDVLTRVPRVKVPEAAPKTDVCFAACQDGAHVPACSFARP